MTTSTSFTDSLRNFKVKVDDRSSKVFAKIVIDLGTSLVFKSPVGDASYWQSPAPKGYVGGRFRANWRFGIDDPDTSISDQVDPSGSQTISVIVGKAEAIKGQGVFYLTNSLPYGPRLENGWSRQAPQGMVHLTVMEFRSVVSGAIRAIKATA